MVIPTGYAQVNVIFTGAAVPTGAQVTFGVENATGLTPAQIGTAVAAQMAGSTIMTNFSTDVTITGYLVKVGPNSTGASAFSADALTGTTGTDSEPPMVAALIDKRTAVGGRKGRGRMFWPGLAPAIVDDGGTITPANRTAMQTDFTAFLTLMDAASLPLHLLHGDSGDAPNEITSLSVQSRVGTQRKRNRR